MHFFLSQRNRIDNKIPGSIYSNPLAHYLHHGFRKALRPMYPGRGRTDLKSPRILPAAVFASLLEILMIADSECQPLVVRTNQSEINSPSRRIPAEYATLYEQRYSIFVHTSSVHHRYVTKLHLS